MSDKLTGYADNLLKDIKKQNTDLYSVHENRIKGLVRFEFSDHGIEISTRYVNRSAPTYIALLLKAFNKHDDNFHLPASVMVQAAIQSVIPETHDEENLDVNKEQHTAQQILNRAHMFSSEHSLNEDNANFPVSELKAQHLLLIMNGFHTTDETNEDRHELNKQGETVFIRNILHNGNVAGDIKYLETDTEVTIIRSDIIESLQGQGLGTKAYRDFIDDKLSQGKIVISDNIVSLKAQRVYSRLKGEGYTVTKQPSRMKYRQDLTTLLPENVKKQQSGFPIVHHDGVNTHESGYRLKGSPVFTVTKSPNITLDISPIQITIIDNKTDHEKTFSIYPNKITCTEKQNERLSSFNPALYSELGTAIEQARNALRHKDNHAIKESLSIDDIHIVQTHTVNRKSLELALQPDYTIEVSHGI